MADVTISSLTPASPASSATIPFSNGLATYSTTPAGIVAASPGCVLQVKQAYKTDRWGKGGAGVQDIWWNVDGLSVSITLKKSNSKILVSGTVNFSRDCQTNDAFLRLVRNDTLVGNSAGGIIGHAAGQNTFLQANPVSFSFLDTPDLITNTYKIQALLSATACTMFVNVRGLNDASSVFTLTSNLTLMEISQ